MPPLLLHECCWRRCCTRTAKAARAQWRREAGKGKAGWQRERESSPVSICSNSTAGPQMQPLATGDTTRLMNKCKQRGVHGQDSLKGVKCAVALHRLCNCHCSIRANVIRADAEDTHGNRTARRHQESKGSVVGTVRAQQKVIATTMQPRSASGARSHRQHSTQHPPHSFTCPLPTLAMHTPMTQITHSQLKAGRT